MKILWIYNQHNPSVEYDHWLHMHFAAYLAKTPGIEVKTYGTNLWKEYSYLSIWHDPKKTLADIRKEFNFDYIIVNTKGRCFDYYSPPLYGEKLGNSMLPPDFKDFKATPKIMIEEDYQYEFNNEWYKEMGFNLVLQRHFSNFLKCRQIGGIEVFWHPFSVDVNTFKPIPGRERMKEIVFAGNSEHDIYKDRKLAISVLKPTGLLKHFEGTKLFSEYVECLRDYQGVLCGSSSFNLTPAKIFEIAASGAVLFIDENKHNGMDLLFSPDSYVTYPMEPYEIFKNANAIVDDEALVKSVTEKSMRQVREKHSHEVRIKQLVNILKGL